MKKMLSNWSGRLVSLLVPVFLIGSFLVPSNAWAIKEFREGRDRSGGGGEGDPLDTNDCGGGGGGSDIHDNTSESSIYNPLTFGFSAYRLILVPEFVGGKIVFRILMISDTDAGYQAFMVEGYNAP